MTPTEITEHANKKYRFEPKDCELTRRMKRLAKKDLIKKLMVKYGYAETTEVKQ